MALNRSLALWTSNPRGALAISSGLGMRPLMEGGCPGGRYWGRRKPPMQHCKGAFTWIKIMNSLCG